MCRGSRSTSVQVVGIIRPVGTELYISISNILHLLSAPASLPRVGSILASLVVDSLSYCKFIIVSNYCLIVDSRFCPSRALTRSLEVFTPSTWTYFCYIDECGNIYHRTIHTQTILSDTPTILVKKHDQQPTTIDYNKLKPYFGWVNAETIKKIFKNSTQWAVTFTRFSMKKHFKSRFPAFNIPHRSEAIATDTISLIPLPLILVLPWPKFLLVKTLWSLMCIPCTPPSNLSTPWMIIQDSEKV